MYEKIINIWLIIPTSFDLRVRQRQRSESARTFSTLTALSASASCPQIKIGGVYQQSTLLSLNNHLFQLHPLP
jgi:hypothetical protein